MDRVNIHKKASKLMEYIESHAPSDKDALIKYIAATLQSEENQNLHADLLFFLKKYYTKMSFETLMKEPLESHITHMERLWKFFQTRPSHQAKIQLELLSCEKKECYGPCRLAIQMINDDRPFLVGSLLGLLIRLNVKPRQIVHPIFTVKRDEKGHFLSFVPHGSHGAHIQAESFIDCEVVELATPALKQAVEAQLPLMLKDIELATQDWARLSEKVNRTRQDLKAHGTYIPLETVEELDLFLEWLQSDHFTFLGYAYFELYDEQAKLRREPKPSDRLGVLKIEERCHLEKIFEGITYRQSTRRLLFNAQPLLINKTTFISNVYRPVPMDVLGIKSFDPKGQVKGVHLFVGIFTSIAYDSSARDIPYLRQKISQVLVATDLSPEWHDGKALVHILDSLPRDELFQASIEDLKTIGLQILDLQDSPRVGLFIRHDLFNRYLSCLVYIPSHRFTAELVGQIGEVLAAELKGGVTLTKTHVGSLDFARVHYTISLPDGKIPAYNIKRIEETLINLARSWQEDLRLAMQEKLMEWRVSPLFQRYRHAFSKSYQESYTIEMALEDILKCEEVFETQNYTVHLSLKQQDPYSLIFKLYHPARPMILSDILPILENLGFKVISEIPFKIKAEGAPFILWMHEFELYYEGLSNIEIIQWRAALLEAILKIRDQLIEDDAFNKLVLAAKLTYRQVEVIRAYGKYLRQLEIPFGQRTIQAALLNYPAITSSIIQLFQAKLNPLNPYQDKNLSQAIEKTLDQVTSPDDDRILRRYLNLVHATVRTNYFQRDEQGHPMPYLSFKFDGRLLEDIPLPKPMYEIFVYSTKIEAVHLRGGHVARGGIRWSDRFEDFRTEILGLLKAQMVKNAVIVPVGSKGGFVVKTIQPSMTRDEIQTEGIAGYQLMIQGLLGLTDNLVRGEIVAPPDTARWDEDDPYLVVAADKGTATFSDYANTLSLVHQYWLDDAFASGGSDGYDHKKMGITARGAWESVKRHFYEMGLNPQVDEITMVGVGDMSGDVFGNGLLQSQSLKLLFAFNHTHIFIDPYPDPLTSYQERQRLFRLPRSSWADYNPNLISEGGGVFVRSTKTIPLSPAVKSFLATDLPTMTPDELIKRFLKAPVDLLWFGGIGTFIKASFQSHLEVGDRANDNVRVNGKDVRARVIAEGANLGITHLGRIEYVKCTGGRLNTDAIDNSAGVDCSDHEVNIKILLNTAVAKGLLTRVKRNQFLGEMTQEVSQLVLRDNYLQNLCISMMQALGPSSLDGHIRLIRDLEKRGKLNRALEFLPDDVTLLEMQGAQQGLTRPELSVVMAYGKLFLYEELLKGTLIDDPCLNQVLADYFPSLLQHQLAQELMEHPLRREIIATSLANQVINRMGASYIHDMKERTGKSADIIIKSYWIVISVLRMPQLWEELESYDYRLDNAKQLRIYLDLMRLVRRASLWLIRQISLEGPLEPLLERLDAGVVFYLRDLELFLNEEARQLFQETIQTYKAMGLEEGYAIRLATLRLASESPDILLIGERTQTKIPEVARLYFLITSRFHFSFLKRQLENLHAPTVWIRQAISGLMEDMYGIQSRAVLSVVAYAKQEHHQLADEEELVFAKWLRSYDHLVTRYDYLINEARATGLNDVMVFISLIREIRLLFESVKV